MVSVLTGSLLSLCAEETEAGRESLEASQEVVGITQSYRMDYS